MESYQLIEKVRLLVPFSDRQAFLFVKYVLERINEFCSEYQTENVGLWYLMVILFDYWELCFVNNAWKNLCSTTSRSSTSAIASSSVNHGDIYNWLRLMYFYHIMVLIHTEIFSIFTLRKLEVVDFNRGTFFSSLF